MKLKQLGSCANCTFTFILQSRIAYVIQQISIFHLFLLIYCIVNDNIVSQHSKTRLNYIQVHDRESNLFNIFLFQFFSVKKYFEKIQIFPYLFKSFQIFSNLSKAFQMFSNLQTSWTNCHVNTTNFVETLNSSNFMDKL